MEPTIEQALQQGIAAHNAGNLQEAERAYRAILQSQPKHPDANHNLGVLAISANQIEAALSLFKTALDANPNIEQFWISYIDALVQNKQLGDAKRAIKKGKKRGINAKKLQALLSRSKGMVDTKSPSQEQLNSLLNSYQSGRYGEAEKLAKSITQDFPDYQLAWKVLGAVLADTGRKTEAVAANQTAAILSPQDAAAHINLGITLAELGRQDEAEASYRQAIRLEPDYAEAHNNLGITLHELGRLHEAEESYSHAIALKPDYAEAHNNLGITLKDLDKLDEAEASFRQAIAFKSDYAEAHNNLGNMLKERGTLDEAAASYRQAITLIPNYAEAHYNLGLALQGLGGVDEAEVSFNQAIALNSGFAEAHNNLGILLQELGRSDDAEASYNRAIALKSDYAEAHYNLGITLQELGRLDEAEAGYKKAIALNPDYAEAHNNLGLTFRELGRLDQAEASYNRAIALKPDYADAHHNLSFTLLKRGRLKEGLDKYEWRWKVAKNFSENRPFPQPLWDGLESLQGKRILLWSEQGIGDTINWASCLPLVTSLAGHTILECQEKIVSLLARSFPNIEIRPEEKSNDSKRDDFDFHLPMGSLYRHCFPHIGENSNIDAYLVPNPVRVEFWRDRLGSLGEGPYIGIAWKSSEVSAFRLKHYPPICEWSSVLTVPDVTFINLQYSDFADDLINIKNDFGVTVHNFDDLDQYNDVDDVVALCSALDMVVSTKVTPLIFSSGVGTPTKVANWRQSTWNSVLFNPVCSSVEMFHRDTGEPWDKVFKSIAEEILKP